MFEAPPFWMYVAGFVLLLGPLVTVHELGHLLVARWFGVRAEVFSIGFGREIAGFTDRRGTRWKLAALPLGGYVQFKGDMNPASVPDPRAPREEGSFQHAALWQRALIVAAGPVTNLLLAVFIFAAFYAVFGKPVIEDAQDSRTIGGFAEASPARAAGLQVGDTIIAIDGKPVADFEELRNAVSLHPGRKMVITVERDGARLDYPVTAARVVKTDAFGNVTTIGQIGVAPAGGRYVFADVSVLEAVPLAVRQCWDLMAMMLTGIRQILGGERSFQELGGPLKIAKYSGEQLSLGLAAFINFVALISLNLAFINLLPIPALDGGHLMFYLAEAIRGRPVGPKATQLAYRTGIALLLTLMAVVTLNDLFSLPLFRS